jgi:MFS family permease
VIVLGLPFYKSEPHHFTCKGINGKWSSCTKDYICTNNLGKGEYLADTDDNQYINNWVEQVDMLCESKSRIGFMGACFFIGVITASSVIPIGYLADIYGRKWVFVASMISEIISCYLLL